jgi:hypothetical protein
VVDRLSRIRDSEDHRGLSARGGEEVALPLQPWRLGISIGTEKALVATGREAFVKLWKAAGVYGELLDLLKTHKWIYIKLATDDGFRAAYKQNKKSITVAGVVMYLELVSGRGGSLIAKYFTRDPEKALEVADKLKTTGLRPNIVKSSPNYVVYIATADLLKLAEEDDAVKRAIAPYLTEKVKNGTPRQRGTAEKILKRRLLFLLIVSPLSRHCHALAGVELERRAWPICGTAEPTTTNIGQRPAASTTTRRAQWMPRPGFEPGSRARKAHGQGGV